MEKDSDNKKIGKSIYSFVSTLFCILLVWWLIEWIIDEYRKIFTGKL